MGIASHLWPLAYQDVVNRAQHLATPPWIAPLDTVMARLRYEIEWCHKIVTEDDGVTPNPYRSLYSYRLCDDLAEACQLAHKILPQAKTNLVCITELIYMNGDTSVVGGHWQANRVVAKICGSADARP